MKKRETERKTETEREKECFRLLDEKLIVPKSRQPPHFMLNGCFSEEGSERSAGRVKKGKEEGRGASRVESFPVIQTFRLLTTHRRPEKREKASLFSRVVFALLFFFLSHDGGRDPRGPRRRAGGRARRALGEAPRSAAPPRRSSDSGRGAARRRAAQVRKGEAELLFRKE